MDFQEIDAGSFGDPGEGLLTLPADRAVYLDKILAVGREEQKGNIDPSLLNCGMKKFVRFERDLIRDTLAALEIPFYILALLQHGVLGVNRGFNHEGHEEDEEHEEHED